MSSVDLSVKVEVDSQAGLPTDFVKNTQPEVAKSRILRCLDWLRQQNDEDPKKATLQNKDVNDIQFILETNAERRNFLLSSADDDETVPAGVFERSVEPVPVVMILISTLVWYLTLR